MDAIIKQIQEALEHGRPLDIKTGTLGAQVLKEIQKCTRTLEKPSQRLEENNSQKKVS